MNSSYLKIILIGTLVVASIFFVVLAIRFTSDTSRQEQLNIIKGINDVYEVSNVCTNNIDKDCLVTYHFRGELKNNRLTVGETELQIEGSNSSELNPLLGLINENTYVKAYEFVEDGAIKRQNPVNMIDLFV